MLVEVDSMIYWKCPNCGCYNKWYNRLCLKCMKTYTLAEVCSKLADSSRLSPMDSSIDKRDDKYRNGGVKKN